MTRFVILVDSIIVFFLLRLAFSMHFVFCFFIFYILCIALFFFVRLLFVVLYSKRLRMPISHFSLSLFFYGGVEIIL